MNSIHSDKDGTLLLSSSNIGSIRRCGCCNSYHLSLGNLTLRLHHTDMLTLTEMLIEALELNAIYGLNENQYIRKKCII